MNRAASLTLSAGKLLWKAYTCHVLVFTAGVICGAVEAFVILAAMWGPR
jgi:hypothetical protein